jgi:hypothetical protein
MTWSTRCRRRCSDVTLVDSSTAALPVRHLFCIRITLHNVVTVGDTPAGHRRVLPVAGGRFEGPRISGNILGDGGADWLLRRPDGAFQQDVRLTLQADDGAFVLMSYRGVRHSPVEVGERIARGEQVPPTDYYLRTAPFFETAAPQYAWLNTIVTIGVGEIGAGGATYNVFEVL